MSFYVSRVSGKINLTNKNHLINTAFINVIDETPIYIDIETLGNGKNVKLSVLRENKIEIRGYELSFFAIYTKAPFSFVWIFLWVMTIFFEIKKIFCACWGCFTYMRPNANLKT